MATKTPSGQERRQRKGLRLLLLLGGVLLLVWLLYGFAWSEIGDQLAKARLEGIILVAGLIVLYFFLRSWRWYLLVEAWAPGRNFWSLHASTALGVGLGSLAPLQAGEVTKVECLARETGLSRIELGALFVFERLLDLLVLGLMVASGVVAFVSTGVEVDTWILFVVGGGLVAGAIFACIVIRTWPQILGRVLAAILPVLKRPGLAASALGLSLLAWATVVSSWSALAWSFHIDLSLAHASSLCGSVTALRILSFIPAGIGIEEAGVVGLMPLLAHTAVESQTFAITLRLLDLLLVGLALCFLPFVQTTAMQRES